jgi:hypothetical protein
VIFARADTILSTALGCAVPALPLSRHAFMSNTDSQYAEVLIDAYPVTIPTAEAWQEIVRNGAFLGTPVYSGESTRKLVNGLLTFVSKHEETFRLGVFRSKGLRSWTVLPLLLVGDRLQRVQIEYVTCGQCGGRVTIANPSEPSLYFGVPDSMRVQRDAARLPRVGCPICSATLPRIAAWAEIYEHQPPTSGGDD